jgi:hypothetical protein
VPSATFGHVLLEDRHGTDVPSSPTHRAFRSRRRRAGVAYHVGRRRAEHDQYNQQAAEAHATSQDQPMPPRYVAPPPASTGGEVDELGRLVQMHNSSGLSDDEFAAAKAQLLGT